MLRYLYSLCGSRELALDLMQEVFLRAGLFQGDVNNDRSWLLRIAKNRFLNEMRSASGKREVPLLEKEMEGAADLTIAQEGGGLLLALNSGILRGIVRDRPLPQQIVVRTPDARFRITGTTFVIAVPRERETYYCLCHGKMEYGVRGAEGWNSLETKSHHALFFRSDLQGRVSEEPGTLLYHTDEIMERLAKSIAPKTK